jgi:hypothetical protein
MLMDKALRNMRKMIYNIANDISLGFHGRSSLLFKFQGEQDGSDALLPLKHPQDFPFIGRSGAVGSWHPSTGSYKHHFATLQVSSGSRCLVAAAQVSSSTKPPVQHI